MTPPRAAVDADAAGLAWTLALAAAAATGELSRRRDPVSLALGEDGRLAPLAAGHNRPDVVWRPCQGYELSLPADDPRRPLLELYLPIVSASAAMPITVGHLGQSLDGFIAMHTGESQFVTGHENILHMHRMRALCDAVVVGARTVAADDPQLTTRHVPGPNPLRVVVDPMRRLGPHHRVFTDTSAPTLYVCASARVAPGETHIAHASILGVGETDGRIDLTALLGTLRERGCARVFVEGGGVTVSRFIEDGLLDRLHMAIAPLIIGNGRPAIRLTPPSRLDQCQRPRYRVFRMGGDVLFDCDLRAGEAGGAEPTAAEPPISRII